MYNKVNIISLHFCYK